MLAVALVASACSGGDGGADDAASVNSVAPTSSSTTTTEAPPETSTTTAPPTTTSTTTTSTTTTTTAPELSDEEQIAELIEAFYVGAFLSLDPPDPDRIDWLEVATPRNAEARRAAIQQLIDNNEGVGQADPDSPFVLASKISLVNQDFAFVMLCLRDDAFAYELDSGDVTRAASVVSVKRLEVVRLDVGWRVERSEQVRDYTPEEAQLCADSL